MYRLVILFAVAVMAVDAGAQAPQDNPLSSADALAAAPVCCRSPAGFPAERVSMPINVTLAIDRSAPAYAFSTGKTFFRMIELPPNDAPYVLTVESHISPAGATSGQDRLFCPVLVFLDENRKLLGAKSAWIFSPLLDLKDQIVGMKSSVMVDDRLKRARYIVVQTADRHLSKAFEAPTQMGMRRVISGGETTSFPTHKAGYSIPFGVEGRVTLRSSSP